MTEHQRPSTLITGAASGLGRRLAYEAHSRGYHVYLVDKSPEVAAIAQALEGEYLVADLADRESLDSISRWADAVGMVFNNAGIAKKGQFHQTELADAEKIVRVNVMAPLILTRLFLEKFCKRNSGVIVNISSSASYFPTPGLASYGATKAFLTSLGETLSMETLDMPNVRVLTVCPSGIDTNFQASSGVRRELNELLLNPSDLARKIFNDVLSGRAGIRDYGRPTHIIRIMRRMLPRKMFLRILGYMMKQYR